jgi:enoyl-CoA hydratase/carnithine racemase
VPGRAIEEGDGLAFENLLGEAQEGEAALFGDLVATADAREGIRAFLEKRAPRFEDR